MRTGNEQLGILAPYADGREAGQLAARLERALGEARCRATFGWATYPNDGDNALALFTAASERMYARKIVLGGRRVDALRPELVDELLHHHAKG